MSESDYPHIVFAERLSTGVVVHFDNGVSVFFPAAFLYEHRDAESNKVFREDHAGDAPQDDEDTRHWRFVIKIIGRHDN